MVSSLSLLLAAQAMAAPPLAPRTCDPFMLFFDSGSAALTQESLRMIDNIVSVKDEMKQMHVEGFADAPGSESYNLRLSIRRAEAVKAVLSARGVPASTITVSGRGETRLLIETDQAEGRNRLVAVSDC